MTYFGLLIAVWSFSNCFAESELTGASCYGPGISRVCMHAARHSSLGRHVAASEHHIVKRKLGLHDLAPCIGFVQLFQSKIPCSRQQWSSLVHCFLPFTFESEGTPSFCRRPTS